MRHTKFLLFFVFLLTFPAFSQVSLPYSINTGIHSTDSTLLPIPQTYIDTSGHFVLSGFSPNTIVPDFTLYDTLGNPTTLSATLNLGKPVLLVSVSFSCPSSRHSIHNVLDDIVTQYGNQINILLIYVVEAHPIYPDYSPYAHSVWTTTNNFQDSVLINQETEYYQRKENCETFMRRFNITVPVLLDDSANSYWSTFGPAPNNAYLLKPNGEVFAKYGWFDQSKYVVRNDINTLLYQVQGVPGNVINTLQHVQIYPNPTNGKSCLYVQNETSYNFHIVDMNRRIVASETNVTSSVSDLEKYNLSAGSYIVIVETHSGETFSLRYILK